MVFQLQGPPTFSAMQRAFFCLCPAIKDWKMSSSRFDTTIHSWAHSKQSLAPNLQEAGKHSVVCGGGVMGLYNLLMSKWLLIDSERRAATLVSSVPTNEATRSQWIGPNTGSLKRPLLNTVVMVAWIRIALQGLRFDDLHQGVALFEMAERCGLIGESTSLRVGSEVSKDLSKSRVSLLVLLPADPGVKP